MLFPKKEGQVKKGLVNDSTDLQVAAQDNSRKLMGTTPYALRKREKAVTITQAMRDEKVYQKLRLERVNKYYKGKRDKKARDAEAAKEKWFISLYLSLLYNHLL